MDIKVMNKEGVYEPVFEPETQVMEEVAETQVAETQVAETQETEKTETEIQEPEKTETPKNEFPSERFEGKFQSWEDIEAALSAPKEPEYKDDFIKKLVDKYNNDGSLEDFFQAYSVDWNKMGDVDVVKRNFFDEHSDLDSKIVEKLWNKKLREYNVDPDLATEEELEENLAILARDANRLRKTYIDNQKQYIEPQKTQVNPEDEVKKIRAVVEMQPETKSLREGKKVTFDIDGEPFNYLLDDVETVVDSLVDENVFRNLFIDSGKVNIDKWSKAVAFAKNPQAMIKSFVDHGKTLARAEIEQELGNAKISKQQPSAVSEKSPDFMTALAQEFAKNGKIVK